MAILRKPIQQIASAIFCVCVMLAASRGMPAQTSAADRTALPNSAVPTIRTAFVPMTREERLRQYFKDVFSPTSFLSAGAAAGIGQWRNQPDEWGQGGTGYAKRYTSAWVEHYERTTIAFAVASVRHEDNRYFASGGSTTGARIGYAVGSTFLTRREDGTRHFSFSKLAAFAGAAAISRLWQPAGHRTFRGGVANLTTSYSVDMGFNVAREFLPQVFH